MYMILDYANKFKDVYVIGLVRDPRSVRNSTKQMVYQPKNKTV